MTAKKFLTPVIVTALTLLVFVAAHFLAGEARVNDIAQRAFILVISGVLVIAYVLRIALVFFGLFAFYRVLRERVNGQDYRQVEV